MTKPTKEDLPPERSGFRVVPKWKAIKDVPGVLPFDDLREILREQKVIALVPCSDKRVYRDRECGIPEECCVVVSNAARYNLGRGVGRELTYEEALALFDQWDKDPIINNVTNQRHVNQLMCNCHWCCCPVFKDSAPSRFVATVEPEKCRSCKICVDRCQFMAAEMKYYPEFDEERAYIDPDLCRGCGCCVITCPAEARSMKVVRPPEHIPDNVALG